MVRQLHPNPYAIPAHGTASAVACSAPNETEPRPFRFSKLALKALPQLNAMKAKAGTNPELIAQANDFEKRYNEKLALRDSQTEQKATGVANEVTKIGDRAQNEQSAVADTAKKAAFGNMMTGLTQMIGGYTNMKVAQINKNTAAQMAAATANTPSWSFGTPPNPAIAAGNPLAGGPGSIAPGPSTVGNNGSAAAASPTNPIALGNPIANSQPSGLANPAPPGAAFKPSDATTTGGGGGGVGGGGSTSPATASNDETPPPRLAPNSTTPAYEGAGSGGYRSGGGGAGSNGPDLSGLLAQFLPKNGGEESGPKNGIIDRVREAGRSPGDDGSILGRGTNIFDRVHQTYQVKQSKRAVGI